MTGNNSSASSVPNHSQNSDDTIHVALTVHDTSGKYSQHAGVVMASIFENTKSKVTVHILHDETLTEDNRHKFIRTAEKYSQGLELHDVTDYRNHISENIINFLTGNNFTVGSLYRLALQDIVQLDKVIYLDCDIVVNMDIRGLWEIDTDGKYIAAVPDEGVTGKTIFSRDRLRNFINGCNSPYINSGVLVMDLKEIRRRGDFFTEAAQWMKEHLYSIDYADQDAYNTLFSGSIKLMDKKFNRQFTRFTFFDGSDLSDTIIHDIWPKPWKAVSQDENCMLYWKMLMKSAWGENLTPVDVVRIIADIYSSSPEYHRTTGQCVLYAFYKGLSILFDFFGTPVMIIKHIYHKLTRR